MHSRTTLKDILIGVMFAAAIVSGVFMTHRPDAESSFILPGPGMSQTQPVVPPQGLGLGVGLGVVGVIAKISGNEITFGNFTVIPVSVTGTGSRTETMVVTVGASTAIELVTPKDEATITKERDAFIAQITKLQAEGKLSTTTPLTPPTPFIAKTLTLKDLNVGDTVTAYAASDITKASSFTATKIDLFNIVKQ